MLTAPFRASFGAYVVDGYTAGVDDPTVQAQLAGDWPEGFPKRGPSRSVGHSRAIPPEGFLMFDLYTD